jgi:hypothetical protein
VEALPLRAGVFLAALLAEGLEDGLQGGGALGGEIALQPAGAVEGDPEFHAPVLEAVVGIVAVVVSVIFPVGVFD